MKKIFLVQYSNTNVVFENRIKEFKTYAKIFNNSWLIATNNTPKQIYEIITFGFENQTIIIVEIQENNIYGRMNPQIWEWIRKAKTS